MPANRSKFSAREMGKKIGEFLGSKKSDKSADTTEESRKGAAKYAITIHIDAAY